MNINEKSFKKVQRALNKLASEEWIAATFYEQMILACDPDDREFIVDIFRKNADDEKNDHYQKLIDFALKNEMNVPCKMSDYEKYAGESCVRQFEKWSKGKNAGYYIDQGIQAEQDAIQSYEEILNDEDVCQCFKAMILEFYYDEIEHLSNLSTLKVAYSIRTKINF